MQTDTGLKPTFKQLNNTVMKKDSEASMELLSILKKVTVDLIFIPVSQLAKQTDIKF